ncbi:MAG: nucleotidyltransferase family protein [Thermoguttaceae bacterium]
MNERAIGLSSEQLEMIVRKCAEIASIRQVQLFGSRATGKFRPNSDIDLAISGLADVNLLEQVKQDLDELPLPFQFDVVSTELIQSPELLQRINSESVTLYINSCWEK